MAAEIAERYPDKNVTLVHNKELLVGRGMSEEFYERLDNYLRQLNIDVIKGDSMYLFFFLYNLGKKIFQMENCFKIF